ncbi:hypothetical protein BHM03_00026438 [Ensete ventricosum]|uniref:CTP synthase N-terminal domain-containing protein n=1 Tax=Ensete ventricosum TaxID=4639 RepID=A0A445MH67_ENSVE|nr:hypothetical protein BHM03_00026438 [Ensete ventricosum]
MIPVDGKEGPADVCVIELGGTIGKSPGNFCLVHVSLVPVLSTVVLRSVSNIVTLHDVTNIWHIPLLLMVDFSYFSLFFVFELYRFAKEPMLEEWMRRAEICDALQDPVNVFCYLTDLPCYIKGSKTHMGGTMRLGSRRTYFKVPSCKAAKL